MADNIQSGTVATQVYKGNCYGALILPYSYKDTDKISPQVDNKTKQGFKNKLTSALHSAGDKIKETVNTAIKNPSQFFNNVATYMLDERNGLSTITSKYSGIAVAQTLMTGKVTTKECADYLFLGFAPALNVAGSALGYTGVTQMKDALLNGDINVGSFVSGFTKTLKGAIDLKDQITGKNFVNNGYFIEFDLTTRHRENYSSNTGDRRVERGQTLSENVQNDPVTFEVNCALQEGKRYTLETLRAILTEVRDRQDVVKLQLGDEIFENLILMNFSPDSDCSKSGANYVLSFKQIEIGIVDFRKVDVQKLPVAMTETTSTSTTAGGVSTSKNVSTPNVMNMIRNDKGLQEYASTGAMKTSVLKYILNPPKN